MNQDHQDIQSVVIRWAYALDQKDWALARTCFAEQIEADYRDLRSGSVELISADLFVQKRSDALANLKTLHLSANHVITLNKDDATCNSAFIIYRKDPSREDENSFNSYGYYFHSLKKIGLEWKIVKVRQQLLWNEGNPLIHSGVAGSPGKSQKAL